MKRMFTSELKVRTIRDDMTATELSLYLGLMSEWGDAEDAASRGALYLDRVMPDWYEHVSIQELRLDSTCSCVLGQIFANDFDGLEFSFQGNDTVPVQFANTNRRVNASLSGFGIGMAVLDIDSKNFPELDANQLAARHPAMFFGFDHSPMYDYTNLTVAWTEEILARVSSS